MNITMQNLMDVEILKEEMENATLEDLLEFSDYLNTVMEIFSGDTPTTDFEHEIAEDLEKIRTMTIISFGEDAWVQVKIAMMQQVLKIAKATRTEIIARQSRMRDAVMKSTPLSAN